MWYFRGQRGAGHKQQDKNNNLRTACVITAARRTYNSQLLFLLGCFATFLLTHRVLYVFACNLNKRIVIQIIMWSGVEL